MQDRYPGSMEVRGCVLAAADAEIFPKLSLFIISSAMRKICFYSKDTGPEDQVFNFE